MAKYIDDQGQTQEVQVGLDTYRAAFDENLSLAAYLNRQHPVAEGEPTAFQQMLASEGIHLRSIPEHGIHASRVADLLSDRQAAGNTVVRDQASQSRILFPAAILSAMEDRLQVDRTSSPAIFDRMVAVDDVVPNTKYERPLLNFSEPEKGRSQVIGQLAMPARFLSITTSEVSRTIPTYSLGIEISDQAQQATSLDLLTLALTRQAEVERSERAYADILAMLQGDKDMDMLALSQVPGRVKKAADFDSTISTAGKLTHKAWIKWLSANSTRRRIDFVITDIDTAMAIEGREGKPTIQGDNPNSPRIDTMPAIANPLWPANVQVFITDDPAWPANTIMGLDSRFAIHRVTSLSASYQAIEAFALKRSTALRFDHGQISYRLFDEAFEVLTLTTD